MKGDRPRFKELSNPKVNTGGIQSKKTPFSAPHQERIPKQPGYPGMKRSQGEGDQANHGSGKLRKGDADTSASGESLSPVNHRAAHDAIGSGDTGNKQGHEISLPGGEHPHQGNSLKSYGLSEPADSMPDRPWKSKLQKEV